MRKIRNLDISIVISINIWQKIAKNQRKKRRLESATSAIKWDILQRTIGQDRR